MIRLWLIAARNLMENRRRTLLLGGAIALVTVLLVLLVGVSGGMQATLLRSATTLITGHVNVGGFYKVTSNSSAPLVKDYAKLVALVEAEVPELDFVVDRVRGWGRIISERSSQNSSVQGVDITREKQFGDVVEVLHGSADGLREPGTALVFASQAERLEVDVGDMITVSAPTFKGVNNTVDVRVVAIAKDVGFISGFQMFVPTSTVRELYQYADTTTGTLMLYLKDRGDVDVVHKRLRARIDDAGYELLDHEAKPFWMKFDSVNRSDWTGQRLDITTWEDDTALLSLTIAGFDAMAGMLIVILLIIIIIGIMNTLYMAIRERTGEIGTLRAIGMQKSRVLIMFVFEAFLLSAVATAVGAGIGVALAGLINAAEVELTSDAVKVFLMSDTLMLAVDFGDVIQSLAIVVGATTVFSLLPSWHAARMRPVTAMHHAG